MQTFDTVSDFDDFSSCFIARGEWIFGIGTIQPLAHHQVGEVDSSSVDPDSDLSQTWHRVIDLYDSNRVDPADLWIDYLTQLITH